MLAFTPWLIKKEFETRGYKCTTFEDRYLVLVQKAGISFFYNCNLTPAQNLVAHSIAKDKYLTKLFLDFYNFPTARAIRIERDTVDKALELNFPVVVKPLEEEGGKGVLVGISNIEKINEYFNQNNYYQKLLVEEMLQGEDVRILIIQGKFFAAVKRIPAYVVADGIHSVSELVEIENQARLAIITQQELSNTYLTNKRIIQDKDIEANDTLKSQGLEWDSIVEKDRSIQIRRNANLSTGGTSADVTDKVCFAIRNLCEDIASKLNTPTLGIDIMTQDLSQPLDISKNWGIIEINSNPGLSMHVFAEGFSRNPVSLIVDEIEAYMAKGHTLRNFEKVQAENVMVSAPMS